MRTLQKFASVRANVHNHFNLDRHLTERDLQDPPLCRHGRVAGAHGLRRAGEGEGCIQRIRVRIRLTAPN
jgi:putative transposase